MKIELRPTTICLFFICFFLTLFIISYPTDNLEQLSIVVKLYLLIPTFGSLIGFMIALIYDSSQWDFK